MKYSKHFLAGLIFALASLPTHGAMAYAPRDLSLDALSGTQMAAVAPLGFQLFCLQNPSECKTGNRNTAPYSQSLMKMLAQVNSQVNRSIKGRNDRGADTWTLNASAGDCEDYVLAKRHALIKAGVPSGALRVATAYTRSGEGHAVLIVKTSRGDYVLDNLTSRITTKSGSSLKFIAISGANPTKWSRTG